MPSILALERQQQGIYQVQGQPGPQIAFQHSQGYTTQKKTLSQKNQTKPKKPKPKTKRWNKNFKKENFKGRDRDVAECLPYALVKYIGHMKPPVESISPTSQKQFARVLVQFLLFWFLFVFQGRVSL